MNKVATTYWNNGYAVSNAKRQRTKSAKLKANGTPRWFAFTIIVSISFMLCMAINFRAFSDMRQELQQNEQYNIQVENLTTENLAIQQETHKIKSDERTIGYEARKIGLSRPNEKFLVPSN